MKILSRKIIKLPGKIDDLLEKIDDPFGISLSRQGNHGAARGNY